MSIAIRKYNITNIMKKTVPYFVTKNLRQVKEEKIICVVCSGKNKKCVACNGTGKIIAPAKKYIGKKDPDGKIGLAAIKLRKASYTLREIASILGYKGPQSVAHLINRANKKLSKK